MQRRVGSAVTEAVVRRIHDRVRDVGQAQVKLERVGTGVLRDLDLRQDVGRGVGGGQVDSGSGGADI